MDSNRLFLHDRSSKDYRDGVELFLKMAKGEVNDKNETRYSCRKYKNLFIYELDIVELHFRRDGFARNYKRWIFHGEEIGHGKGNAGGSLHAEADEDDEDDSEEEDENVPTSNHSRVPMSFNNVLEHLVGHGSSWRKLILLYILALQINWHWIHCQS